METPQRFHRGNLPSQVSIEPLRDGNCKGRLLCDHIGDSFNRTFEGWKLKSKKTTVRPYTRFNRTFEGWKLGFDRALLEAPVKRFNRTFEGWKPP